VFPEHPLIFFFGLVHPGSNPAVPLSDPPGEEKSLKQGKTASVISGAGFPMGRTVCPRSRLKIHLIPASFQIFVDFGIIINNKKAHIKGFSDVS
jgi:hypothetical protein